MGARWGVAKQHILSNVSESQNRYRLLIALATEVAAVASAASYVAVHQWFGRGDLAAMATWSSPLALGVAVVIPVVARRVSRLGIAPALLTLLGAGVMLGVLWTGAVAMILGGWIATFSFPVLVCWTAGGFFGGVTAVCLERPRSWRLAAAAGLVGVLGISRVDAYEPAPERAIRVILRPMATDDDVEKVWTTVLARRTGRGDEHTFLPSLSSIAASGREGSSPVLVATFWSGVSQRTRDSVVAEIARSPLILRVDTGVTP